MSPISSSLLLHPAISRPLYSLRFSQVLRLYSLQLHILSLEFSPSQPFLHSLTARYPAQTLPQCKPQERDPIPSSSVSRSSRIRSFPLRTPLNFPRLVGSELLRSRVSSPLELSFTLPDCRSEALCPSEVTSAFPATLSKVSTGSLPSSRTSHFVSLSAFERPPRYKFAAREEPQVAAQCQTWSMAFQNP